jgi:hypothetical protein
MEDLPLRDPQFRPCPPVGYIDLHAVFKKDHSHMKPETIVLITREATKQDVDKWMEDLFARIQLCLTHPHSVIQRDGVPQMTKTQCLRN